MHSRYLLRAGAIAALLLLVGVFPAGALPLHPSSAPPSGVEAPSGPGLLAGLWGGLLELVGVDPASASTGPASPPISSSGDGEISTLDGGDGTTDASDDEESTPGLDPNG